MNNGPQVYVEAQDADVDPNYSTVRYYFADVQDEGLELVRLLTTAKNAVRCVMIEHDVITGGILL